MTEMFCSVCCGRVSCRRTSGSLFDYGATELLGTIEVKEWVRWVCIRTICWKCWEVQRCHLFEIYFCLYFLGGGESDSRCLAQYCCRSVRHDVRCERNKVVKHRALFWQ